jgi:ketosteroid isomerase-like protein
MKKSIMLLMLSSCIAASAFAQQDGDAVKKTIQVLFDGMRNADSNAVLSVFAPNAIMQTIAVNKDGKTIVGQNQVANFASYIGKQSKGAADEQIVFDNIKVDGDLAVVWTPYRFVYNGKFSHCGVNSFTLVKMNGDWKINYLIDTRRKENCN